MRGSFTDQGGLFSYIAPDKRVPANHPLRKVRELVRDVLSDLNRSLGRLYASEAGFSWWPVNLGTPSPVGTQNELRYAVFPGRRRLAIKDGGRVEIHDTGNHRIFGVAQAQSADQTLTVTSQDGLVRVKDLPKVAE